jgi:hypothetical protein
MPRMSRRQRNRWFYVRMDILVSEGFSPEEASLIAYTRISSSAVRRLRRNRKRLVQAEIDRGAMPRDATVRVYSRIRETDQEVIDWDAFRRLAYK